MEEKITYIFVGAFLGFILSIAKDLLTQYRERKKEKEYLAIHVSFLLERFVEGCVNVTFDDGLSYGQPDQDGCRSVQVKTPNLNLQSLDVNWKALPKEIMYKIFDLPNEIYSTNQKISNAAEYSAFPPDYEDVFEERQYGYSKLGILALDHILELRKISGIPARPISEYDSRTTLVEKRDKIKQRLRKENQDKLLDINA